MYETKLANAAISGSSAGAAYQNANAPQSMPRLDALTVQLANMRDIAGSLASRSRVLTERLLGTQPEKLSPAGAEANPTCKVRELEVLCEGIRECLALAHSQFDRLESL